MSLIEVMHLNFKLATSAGVLHRRSDKYSSRRQNTYVESKISLLKIMKELLIHRYCE